MFWESSGVVGFDREPLLEGQMRTAKLKSAYNSLIIGPRGFGALSLRWIQFASVLRCARSSLMWGIFLTLMYNVYCEMYGILTTHDFTEIVLEDPVLVDQVIKNNEQI